MRAFLTRILVGAVAVVLIAALPAQDAAAQLLSITKTADLKFGSVIVDNVNPGTVAISPAGVRTCGAPLACFGFISAAGFSVSGDLNEGPLYTITLPLSTTISNGANSMTVDTFVDSEGGIGAFDQNGNGSFTVGATLHVGAGQVQGTYTGTFTVTVNYE